jgi:uncharacterized protein (DUF885 family)
MLRRALPFALALTACAATTPSSTTSSGTAAPCAGARPPASAADTLLDHLFDGEWEESLAASPIDASISGDRRWNDKWPDVSLAGVGREHARAVDALKRLHAIPRASLSDEQKLNYDLFEREEQQLVDGAPFLSDSRLPIGFALLPVNQRDGIQLAGDVAVDLRFETRKDYEDWIARMRAFPAYVDQTMALMREGIRRRFVHPRLLMERVSGQIDKQIVPSEESSFYGPFKRFPAALAPADRDALARAAKEAIDRDVVPAYRRFKEFFTKEYLPACFDDVGAWQLPNGAAFYAYSARVHTTTRLTPKEIHETGLREVARIRAAMQAILAEVGFKGSLKDFFTLLRTDPRFFYKTSDELWSGYRIVAKRIDPTLVRLFKTLPRTTYGVEPIPADVAPDTTTAYYQRPADDGSRPGTFYVNLYKPEARPKWEMMALALHESVPGHHLQIALAQEHGALPEFRKHAGMSAFVEGWALYAESLGAEVGLYDDPYSRFGQLTYEMWRAVRLVVDTGIHEMHWSRKQAIDYFLDNAAKSELDVTNEIDRYITWPGQALAYKVGELKIKELRARAQAALGSRFDLRTFHDVVLEEGAVPLDELEKHVDAWIAKERAAAGSQGPSPASPAAASAVPSSASPSPAR